MADRTKLWIADAMKRLLTKKSLERIFVTDICKEAEIERPTFYYHFRDKYDLMAWIFFQHAGQTDILSAKSAARSLNEMRTEYFFYKRSYEDNSQNPMWSYMLEYFAGKYTEAVRQKTGKEPDLRTKFSIRLYCYGSLGMTREWFLKDNITPAETIVELMFESMPESLRKLTRTDSNTPS